MANAYWRMRGYDPFFADAGALEWAPPTHVYEDLYAIYRDLPEYQRVLAEHPDWVLRDASGDRLYIPADCNGTSCTQYAGDAGNPEFRRWWIERMKRILSKGYAGVFVDDVNLDITASDGSGTPVTPTDPRTGRPMSVGDWRRYIARFAVEIADALPDLEIVHNVQWYVGHDDESARRQLTAADAVEFERGFSDSGLTGEGFVALDRLLDQADWLHDRGISVILEPYDLTPRTQELELAAYFVIREGEDAIASDYLSDPGAFSERWQLDLGDPLGDRYRWNGLWRRDFSAGTALVNPPDSSPRTVRAEGRTNIDGNAVRTVTIEAHGGAVLLGRAPLVP